MLRNSLIALSMLTAMTAPAYASGLTANQAVQIAVTETAEDGTVTTKYLPADKIAPGDELRYVVSYENVGTDAADNIRLDMPVPVEVEFVEGSVETNIATVTFSIDQGASFAAREALMVADENGERTAAAGEITHIRWFFAQSIAPGEAGEISYRGILQ